MCGISNGVILVDELFLEFAISLFLIVYSLKCRVLGFDLLEILLCFGFC